jgi:hypothetical protein
VLRSGHVILQNELVYVACIQPDELCRDGDSVPHILSSLGLSVSVTAGATPGTLLLHYCLGHFE